MEKTINLKQLILLINDQKNMNANLCLDEGCLIAGDDPKPLVKVINYVVNYLQKISDAAIEIGLDLNDSGALLNFLIPTDASEIPEFSSEVNPVLVPFGAKIDIVHESGKYIQIKIPFVK